MLLTGRRFSFRGFFSSIGTKGSISYKSMAGSIDFRIAAGKHRYPLISSSSQKKIDALRFQDQNRKKRGRGSRANADRLQYDRVGSCCCVATVLEEDAVGIADR